MEIIYLIIAVLLYLKFKSTNSKLIAPPSILAIFWPLMVIYALGSWIKYWFELTSLAYEFKQEFIIVGETSLADKVNMKDITILLHLTDAGMVQRLSTLDYDTLYNIQQTLNRVEVKGSSNTYKDILPKLKEAVRHRLLERYS